jgi:hypothetical protein
MTDAYRRSIYWIDCLLACDPELKAGEVAQRTLRHARTPSLNIPLSEPWWSTYARLAHGQRILATLDQSLDQQYQQQRWDSLLP